METRVQKWGNSLALRIPKSFADEMSISPNSPVNITVIEGKLVVIPMIEADYSLEELLVGVTDENIHSEIETGAAVGNEVW